MPTIPEDEVLDLGMDDFVDWSQAEPAGLNMDMDLNAAPLPLPLSLDGGDDDLNLALANVTGDDFSFWALEHYENNMQPLNESNTVAPVMDSAIGLTAPEDSLAAMDWYISAVPCTHCQRGGFSCKTIREGRYKGYCTSCVALRCHCSFGPAAASGREESNAFPFNPWPTLGDHPNPVMPTLGAHPDRPVLADETQIMSNRSSVSELKGLTAAGGDQSQTDKNPPKVGARFSRESVRILKNWLSTHGRHPYPTDEEKERLQQMTGLNKTQITNWLANARRRGKIQAPRSTSPHVRSFTGAIDIPARPGTPSVRDGAFRRGTPIPFESMNPLQRWANSPPENEPASVSDIARAVTASSSSALSSGLNSPYSFRFTDDGSGRSLCNQSSASSLGTSHSSGGSFASAYSHASRGSFGSFSSLGNRGRRRRRRRATPKRPEDGTTGLLPQTKTFQCTFCTETFRTKHDWQRHEKSLHLSLERWVCAPQGATMLNPETNQISCVFCGDANPDEAHLEGHNCSACQEKGLDERTFYRKDHLRQHLKLVHNVKFLNWSMDPWKIATPEIRSRCGFCGIVMDTWTIRVDHLAEHFKTGNTMADWKGDWGFEAPVLQMVENSIPPYLIHDERNSPLPFTSDHRSPETPRNAYDLLKWELMFWLAGRREELGRDPSDEETQLEACRIVFGSEVLSKSMLSSDPAPSWLRDLVMSSERIKLQAQLGDIRRQGENRMSIMKINGKDNLFEGCPMECELHEYVKARRFLGLTATDSELQAEACKIISRMEESSSSPSDFVANFLVRLIYNHKLWLADFRQRAQLARSEDMFDEGVRSKDPKTIDSTIHSFSRLENDLAEFVKSQRALGIEPDDASLQQQARIIIYEFDDGWNQTAADNAEWLAAFRARHVDQNSPAAQSADTTLAAGTITPESSSSMQLAMISTAGLCDAYMAPSTGISCRNNSSLRTSPYFLNDANCYRRLAKELTRFVASTMSPNNPNFHIPSDEELQHQARWILYDSDDTWNQTAADNAEWLQRFKRDVGILPAEEGPGLPTANTSWAVSQGGSGFAPPYAFPKASMAPFGDDVQLELSGAAKTYAADSSTVNKFLQSLTTRYSAPATVFCSRELEKGLIEYVVAETATATSGVAKGALFPSDAQLRAKAREVMGTATTPADDEVLLAKFKDMVRDKCGIHVPLASEERQQQASVAAGAGDAGEIDFSGVDLGINIPENELNDILMDMNFDFGEGADLGGGAPLI